MSAANLEGGRRGRPRHPSTDQAIFAAAAELINERGYDGFSMAAVADRAGVAKTTVYRRWPTRAHLVLGTVTALMRAPIFDSGDLQGDLTAFVRHLAAALRAPGTRRFVAEMAVATIDRPELEDAFQSLFLERRGPVVATIRAAQERGEVRPDLDPELVLDQITGALFYRMLLRGDGPTDAYAEGLVGAVLDGARVRPPPE